MKRIVDSNDAVLAGISLSVGDSVPIDVSGPAKGERQRQSELRVITAAGSDRTANGHAANTNGTARELADPESTRAELLKQIDELATLAAAAHVSTEQYTLLDAEIKAITKELDQIYERYAALLVEHTPEHLELDTDGAAAHILAARYGAHLRRVDAAWRAWDGRRWTSGAAAEQLARGYAREVGEAFSALSRDATELIAKVRRYASLAGLLKHAAEAADMPELAADLQRDSDRWSKFAKHADSDDSRVALGRLAARLTSARGIDAALSVAETLPPLRSEAAAFDARRDLLNCASGIVDLRTGDLLPHDPSYMLTSLCPHAYDPDALAPRWDAFLAEVHPDTTVRAYVSRMWGYRCTGEMREQEFSVLLGPGGDGKSVECDTLAHVLGPDYACVATHGLLVDDARGRSKDAQNATVQGARLVTLPEWPRGAKIDLGHIKHITGGTSHVAANRMRQDTYRFVPTCKIVVSANVLPEIDLTDASAALWQRVRLIRYSQTFRGTAREDRLLIERLRAEAPGILAWAVREAVAYYREGLKVPEQIRAWVAEWRASVHHITAWLDERCSIGRHHRCEGERLLADYRQWAQSAGVERAMSPRQFFAELTELGYHPRTSNGRRYRDGIELAASPSHGRGTDA